MAAKLNISSVLYRNTKVLIIVSCIIFWIFYKYNITEQSADIEEDSYRKTNGKWTKVYKVLYWNPSLMYPDWFGLGQEPFTICSYKNCFATNNKSNVNDVDAILFLNRGIDLKAMPKQRFPWQRWIFVTQESPPNEPNYSIYNGMFNATMTYSSKSDVLMAFDQGSFIKLTNQVNKIDTKNYAAGRNKTVVWFVSNCDDSSKRLQYARNLQKYIPVDIYGKCGTLKCDTTGSSTKCDSMLRTNYKFYLAFENSICDDYVTEKIGRAFNNGIIPIVLGGFNYSSHFPPHSYIDIKDFKSPKELAEHLHMLDKDDAKYNTYFEWKRWYTFEDYAHACSLCKYLNEYSNVVKVYDRLDMFWNTKNNCSTPEKFYKNVDKISWV